jgi:ArsR family transcriptional regulator, arsenate/arsenite/antimonite-responsive transcriptional repressor
MEIKDAPAGQSISMPQQVAVDVLGALAHDARLHVFRLLVQAGPDGLAAGAIAQALQMPASTLSFHLAHLSKAGLAVARQHGRQVIYQPAFAQVRWLTGYLLENCCGGQSCAPLETCSQPECGESS